MPRYVLMGDIHLSDTPPSSCFDSYQDDIFEILEQTVAVALDNEAEAIIWAGDVFHHKTPGRTRHGTVKRLIDFVRASGVTHYVVPGNHDLMHDRLDSLDTSQPLGVVIASGAVRPLVYDWDAQGYVYGVPWLMSFDSASVYHAFNGYRDFHSENYHSLVVTHAPLYPPGQELPYEHYKAADWADAMGNDGSVYYGHVHEPHGIYTAGGVTFCNAGAISRGSLHEHNLTREIQVAVWDSATGQFELVTVPHKPAEQVFKLEAKAAEKEIKANFDAFLTSVGQTRLEVTSVEAVKDHVRGLDIDDSVRQLVVDLLEQQT